MNTHKNVTEYENKGRSSKLKSNDNVEMDPELRNYINNCSSMSSEEVKRDLIKLGITPFNRYTTKELLANCGVDIKNYKHDSEQEYSVADVPQNVTTLANGYFQKKSLAAFYSAAAALVICVVIVLINTSTDTDKKYLLKAANGTTVVYSFVVLADEGFNALYQKVCDGGEMLGCNNLGVDYAQGNGVKENFENISALFRQTCNGWYELAC